MIQRTSKAEQNCQTQSGPKHREKSSDLRRRLKAVSDVDEVTLDGRLFHTREAATGNERSPMVEWRMMRTGGRTSVNVDADLRRRRVSVRHSVEFTSEIWWSRRMQATVREHRQLELYPLWHSQPM